jgi:TonB-dependent receptor
VNVEAELQIETVTEQVIVRGERERGEIEALNREETSDNIVQVLPAEVITSLPNTNIADAVGRLPSVSLERDEGEGKYVQIRGTEPRLSNVTVDGVHLPSPEAVRNVKLDAIPADLVDSVEINKTLSANQEGDAIGGSVNLVTKKASDQPYVTLFGLGGHTPIDGGRNLDQFTGTVGKRFGREKRFGIMFGGSYDWNARGYDDVEPAPGTTSVRNGDFANGVPVFFGEDVRQYWYDRTRFGFATSADYKLGNDSFFYLRGIFSQFKDNGQDWIYTSNISNYTSATTSAPTNMVFNHVFRSPFQQIFNVTLGCATHHRLQFSRLRSLRRPGALFRRISESRLQHARRNNLWARYHRSPHPKIPRSQRCEYLRPHDLRAFPSSVQQHARFRARFHRQYLVDTPI